MRMWITVDLPGVAMFESGSTQRDQYGRDLLDVVKAFGEVLYAQLPRLVDKNRVLITDNKERALTWTDKGGSSIYCVGDLDDSTADTILVELIDLKRELIDAGFDKKKTEKYESIRSSRHRQESNSRADKRGSSIQGDGESS